MQLHAGFGGLLLVSGHTFGTARAHASCRPIPRSWSRGCGICHPSCEAVPVSAVWDHAAAERRGPDIPGGAASAALAAPHRTLVTTS